MLNAASRKIGRYVLYFFLFLYNPGTRSKLVRQILLYPMGACREICVAIWSSLETARVERQMFRLDNQ